MKEETGRQVKKKKKEARWGMGNSCNSIFRAGVSDAKAQKLLRFVWEVGKRRESIE
jgi:hypothetical protein